MQFGRERTVSRSVPCRSSVFLCSEITQKRLLRKPPRHTLRTTKETIQPINKAPRRTLLSGSFVSFVIMVPTERRNKLLLRNLYDYKKATRGDWFLRRTSEDSQSRFVASNQDNFSGHINW